MFWFKKDRSKVKNTSLKWILQNISENLTFQRTTKFNMADFYKMEFMKGIFILVKTDEMHKILKSLLVNRYWSRDESEIGSANFLMESGFHCP